jgi:hypothetical protein
MQISIRCQALNRPITPNDCARAQKELPTKFCIGCEWYSSAITKLTRPKSRTNPKYIPSTYKVVVSKRLKSILLDKAEEHGLQPAAYIAKILAEKLLP